MSFLRRIHAAVSLHVVAARIGTSPSTLRLWAEVGVGPTPDRRGVYQRDVVASWLTEMESLARLREDRGLDASEEHAQRESTTGRHAPDV